MLDRLSDLAVIGVQGTILWNLAVESSDRQVWGAAACYIVSIWICLGLLVYVGSWKSGAARPTYFECALLPLFLFLVEPLSGAILLVVPTALIVTGQWIGGKLQHPDIGAATGFAAFLIAAVAILRSGRTPRRDETTSAQ